MKKTLSVVALASVVGFVALTTPEEAEAPVHEPTPEASVDVLEQTERPTPPRPPSHENATLTAVGNSVFVPPEPEHGWDSDTDGYGLPGDPCTPDPVTGMEDNDACLESLGLEPPYVTEDFPE